MSLINSFEAGLLEKYFSSSNSTRHIDTFGNGNYVGLCTAAQAENGITANEVFASRIWMSTSDWTIFDNTATNNTDVEFSPNSTQTITHFILGDSISTNSTHQYHRALSSSIGVDDGDDLRFLASNLIVEVTGLFTDYLAEDMLEELLGGQTRTRPAPHYYALSTTTPTAAGGNFTEPSGGSYARVTVSNPGDVFPTSASWGDPSTYTTNADITWVTATADWGTLTHWGIFDASTGGNLLFFGAFDSSVTVNNGDDAAILASDLVVGLD